MTSISTMTGGLTALVFLSAVQAQSPSLWTAHPAVTPVAEAWNNGEVADNATLVETRFIQLDFTTLRRNPTATVQLDLFGTTYDCVLQGPTRSFRHDVIRGSIVGQPDATVVFAVNDTQDVVGAAIQLDDGTFGIHYANDADIHVLQRFDLSLETRRCATTGPAVDPRRAAQRENAAAQLNTPSNAPIAFAPGAAGDAVIDVAIFYTGAARAGAGSTASMESQLVSRLAAANSACSATNVLHEYRLVYTGEVSYAETGTSSDLSRFRSTNDGIMDSVHTTRNLYGADLMALIINRSTQFCGVGYLMTQATTSFRSSAFSVTVRGCLAGNTMTHEMGHTMGCAHDRNNSSRGLYTFSFGARTPGNGFRTIMAYSPGQRVNRWSRNGGTWNGLPLGDANNDNARSLNLARNIIRGFWPTRTLEFCSHPGAINGQFGPPRIEGSGTETTATPINITMRLSRIGAAGVLFIGSSALNAPLFGGTLVPNVDISIPIVGNVGPTVVNLDGVRGIGPGVELWMQAWYVDPTGGGPGLSATGGLSVRTL